MGAFHENISVPAAEEGRMSEKELPSDQNLSLRYYVAECMEFDYLSHSTKINEGEADQYYIADHHDPIVSREVWDKAQELLDKQSWQKWKRREQQRLMPVRTGILQGWNMCRRI